MHHHVSSVLSKAGVRTRTAAAREAARPGIGTDAQLAEGETGFPLGQHGRQAAADREVRVPVGHQRGDQRLAVDFGELKDLQTAGR